MRKLFFLGDSTLQYNDASTWPQVGWPQGLPDCFAEDVEVRNLAKNGRSTKSYMEEGLFDAALQQMDENSYVMIEFGHNDEHDYDPDKYTRPFVEYKQNLLYMIGKAREKGATVMLGTPVYRRQFLEDGSVNPDCHKGYREAMIEAAEETGTPYVDFTTFTREQLKAYGYPNSRELFMNFDAGQYENYPEGNEDNTHLRIKGARMIAGIFLREIRREGNPFKALLKPVIQVHVSPVTATFETSGKDPFKTEEPFDVKLDGETVIKGETRNVFTLFNLKPDTEYVMEALGAKICFRTLPVRSVINVLEHGVKGDGVTDDTKAVQKLLDECDHDLIVFPAGVYHLTPLAVRSHTFIHLCEGAELKGSTDRNEYPVLKGIRVEDGKEYVDASWEGEPNDAFMSLITIMDAREVMIVGQGIINGNADNSDWWINHRVKRIAWRSNNIFTNRSSDVDLVGVKVCNSPSWNIHPFYSDHIGLYNARMYSVYTSPNTDGFDPESCAFVTLLGCEIYSGDDCIAIKSGKIAMVKNHYKPCEHILIRNCVMGEGHGAVVFGSESSCGIMDVEVTGCIFENTDRGLRIKTRRGRGDKASIYDVTFDNILMKGAKNALTVNMYYYLSSDDPKDISFSQEYVEPDETTPHLGSFHFRNMRCLDTRVCAGYFHGLPEAPVESITLENIEVTYDHSFEGYEKPAMILGCELLNNAGFIFRNVKQIDVRNVTVKEPRGEAFRTIGCGEFNCENAEN